MTWIIAGGRSYKNKYLIYKTLDSLLPVISKVITGECKTGVDQYGKAWAIERKIPYKGYEADWNDISKPDSIPRQRNDGSWYDAKAGPRRNGEMVNIADGLILFPGNKGTNDVFRQAKEKGILIYDFRKEEICSSELF